MQRHRPLTVLRRDRGFLCGRLLRQGSQHDLADHRRTRSKRRRRRHRGGRRKKSKSTQN